MRLVDGSGLNRRFDEGSKATIARRRRHRASGLCRGLGKNGQQETARIADLERPAFPLRVARFGFERDASVLRSLRYFINAARRLDGQTHADSLLAVASFFPIVLVQAEIGRAHV